MQKTKQWLMTMAVLLCSITASAHDFEVDGIYYNISSNAEQKIAVTYSGTSPLSAVYTGNIAIPRFVTYNGITYTVMSIDEYAFANCSSLTSVFIPQSVTSIGAYAFSYTGIESITIPNSVVSIGDYAFMYSRSLNSIILEDGVKSIGYQAFVGSTNLKTVVLPATIESIGSEAFWECSNITSIICKAINPPTCDNYTFGKVNKDIPLYVPASSVFTYRTTDYWSSFTNILPIKEDIVLTDNEDFSQTETKECASITYTRTFNNTNWQALYVPFEIPVTEELLADFEVADLNDIRQYDRDDDGVKDETVVEAFKVTSGALEANYPYLIRAKEAGEKTITVADATLYATEENSIDCSSVHEKYTFTGTYNTLDAAELAGCYALSGGVWQPVAEDASLGAFRFYLQIESRDDNAQATQSIKMRVTGDDTTEIENSELKIEKSTFSAVYDLQGRRVENPTKGVYVVNGKKVLYN